MGFPHGSVGQESTHSAGDAGEMGLIPGMGRSPGGRHGNPLQYSCLENPMDRGDWWAIVYRVKESDMTEWLTLHFFTVPFSSVAQSCPILCDPMDYTVHGILQARILKWVAFPFFRGSPQPRSPALQADSLPAKPQGKPNMVPVCVLSHWSCLRLCVT